jgi:hypothetical protein
VLRLEILVGVILPALPTAAVAFAAIDTALLSSSFIVVESATTSCVGGSPLTTLLIELRRADCCLSAMLLLNQILQINLESTNPFTSCTAFLNRALAPGEEPLVRALVGKPNPDTAKLISQSPT